MSPAVLLAAAAAVLAVTMYLLRVSGAGRELFGRDAWMLRSRHEGDGLEDSSGSFIEHHEFWSSLDHDADRDFWDEIPDEHDEPDDPDLDIAAGDH